jgi:hypothetical protein
VAAELTRAERDRGGAAVAAAIEEALRLGKPRWAYIKGILENRPRRTVGGAVSDGQEG